MNTTLQASLLGILYYSNLLISLQALLLLVNMLVSKITTALVAASVASCISFTEYGEMAMDTVKRMLPDLSTRDGGGNCPAIWTAIASELQGMFLDKTVNPSQCNDAARAAIREAFHDCGSWETALGTLPGNGGCDGSLILTTGPDAATNELMRGENGGLAGISAKLLALQQKYVAIDASVTVADLIQFAAAVAIVTCPGGPQIKTFVGRKDSTSPAARNLLPDVHAPGADLFALFQRKGFTANELAALLGAHTTSKQFLIPGAPVGAAQDSTPGKWDVQYYADTLNPPAGVFVFPSDTNLAADPTVGKEFKGFVGSQGKWTSAFGSA